MIRRPILAPDRSLAMTRRSPADPTGARPARGTTSLEPLLVAALLGAAAFLVQAGAAEVILARHEACQASLAGLRWAQLPPPGCLSPEALAIVIALGRGMVGALRPDVAAGFAWLVAIPFSSMLAVVTRALGGRAWMAIYLLLQGVLVIGGAAIHYASAFIG